MLNINICISLNILSFPQFLNKFQTYKVVERTYRVNTCMSTIYFLQLTFATFVLLDIYSSITLSIHQSFFLFFFYRCQINCTTTLDKNGDVGWVGDGSQQKLQRWWEDTEVLGASPRTGGKARGGLSYEDGERVKVQRKRVRTAWRGELGLD